jgi:hypothetical protein
MKTLVEQHTNIHVVRDDLLPGGSKSRFLPHLLDGVKEVVYGAPFCGGAPVALAHVGKQLGVRVTIFYAQRAKPHARQLEVLRQGGKIVWIPMGFMSHVQQKAQAYAKEQGALFLPLGFDVPNAEPPFIESLRTVLDFTPDEIWCATSSGMLARCLARAFPSSAIKGVTVGLKSRHEKQDFPSNVELRPTSFRFEQEARVFAPFPICPNYEAKAWMQCVHHAKNRAVFWNVIGR